MATVRTCVSPRVNRPEPWARGRRPTSTEIWRSSVSAAAVHPDALVEGELAGGLLVDEAEQALADARLAAGGLEDGLACRRRSGWPGTTSAMPSLAGRRSGPAGRCRTRSAGWRSPRRRAAPGGAWASSMPKKCDSVGELVVLEVRIALAGDRQRVEVAARLEVGAVGRARPRGSRGRSRPSGRRSIASPMKSSGLLGGVGRARAPS